MGRSEECSDGLARLDKVLEQLFLAGLSVFAVPAKLNAAREELESAWSVFSERFSSTLEFSEMRRKIAFFRARLGDEFFYGSGSNGDAIIEYKAALELDPYRKDALDGITAAYHQGEHDDDAALPFAIRRATLDPSHWHDVYYIRSCRVEKRDDAGLAQRALEFSQRAFELDERSSQVGSEGHWQGDAIVANRNAVEIYRRLTKETSKAFGPDLAASLETLGRRLAGVGRRDEAVARLRESADVYRFLSDEDPSALYAHELAICLSRLAITCQELRQGKEALSSMREAVEQDRALASKHPHVFRPMLAVRLRSLGALLAELVFPQEAHAATLEAATLGRELAIEHPTAFTLELVSSLNNLFLILGGQGRHEEAQAAVHESASLLIGLPADRPHEWCDRARALTGWLTSPCDLRDWHLPLLRLLTEYRELAFEAAHARLFLDLQGLAAARTWALLGALQFSDAALVDEAVAVLVATLHSPDLARWLQARGTDDGTLDELARLKHDVIETEQKLDSLMKRLGGGASGAERSTVADPGTPRAELTRRINELELEVRKHRKGFRIERQRLIQADPEFRSAFGLPGMPALRGAAHHGQGAALLCLLELPEEGSSEPLTVGALVYADGRPTQALAFQALYATARGLAAHKPYGNERGRCGALRRNDATQRDGDGPQKGEVEPGTAEASEARLELLQQQMQQRFWGALQQALPATGEGAVQRLHVCGHGLLQQLPLGLRAAEDCPGLQLLAWPGLPYLRLAAETSLPALTTLPATAPWLIGHDCAWGSDRPLPMVAVEAALLRLLLEQYGKRVTVIERATQLHAGSAALVLCCHGAQADANFDGALALGDPPLTVGQVVQGRLGPPLALLPACFAGETREAAGNALGVSAGFLFGGSRVVLASSKSVPDMLAPWLSTLTVWHVLHGRSLHDSAVTARQQFGTLDFPEKFREWLTKALPQALATIQPGGVEYLRAHKNRCAADMLAIDKVRRDWPWAGDALGLIADDTVRREQATASVALNVLTPRSAIALELPQMLSEMAAFVFVYGAG